MAFQFDQRPNSGAISGNPPRAMFQWIASGNNDPNFVNSYALSATPSIVSTVYGTLYRQDLEVQKQGYCLFHVDVPYGPRENAAGSYTFDFDTTGGTVDVKISLETVNSYKAVGEAGNIPSHDRAIDVQPDGEVRGVPQVIPASRFNVKFRHPLGVVSIPFFKNLAQYTGIVNSEEFLTCEAGELLYIGSTGSDGSAAEAEVTYRFLYSPNATGLSFGQIADVAKKGHEVVWVSFKKEVDEGKSVRQPQFAYVERIYRELNFAESFGWS